MTAKNFCNTVRALDMSGGAFVIIDGKRVKIWRAKPLRVKNEKTIPASCFLIPNSKNPVVSCSDFCVELIEVQSEGRKKTSGGEWARGLRIKQGEIL